MDPHSAVDKVIEFVGSDWSSLDDHAPGDDGIVPWKLAVRAQLACRLLDVLLDIEEYW